MTETQKNEIKVDDLFKVGAHFGFSKSRRHPSVSPFIFGSKNRIDIIDLEKTKESLLKMLDFISDLRAEKSSLLMVGGKPEAREIVKTVSEKIGVPYVASRWIGGTLSNWSEISKRIETMKNLVSQREKGELSKYTKKERILIDRKIEKLQKMFWGIKDMVNLPKVLFIVDPKYDKIALKEAKSLNLKVAALCGSDNDLNGIDFPVVANDSNISSIKFFVEKVGEIYANK